MISWVVNESSVRATNNVPMTSFAITTCARSRVWLTIRADGTLFVQPKVTSKFAIVNLGTPEIRMVGVD